MAATDFPRPFFFLRTLDRFDSIASTKSSIAMPILRPHSRFGSNSTYPPAAPGTAAAAAQAADAALKAAYAAEAPVDGQIANVDGFHDTQLRLEGPAAVDVAANFAQRWSDAHCEVNSEVGRGASATIAWEPV